MTAGTIEGNPVSGCLGGVTAGGLVCGVVVAGGEFVVPADVVSHLGNGSTDAGAKVLYAMMDRVRKARTGKAKQGKKIMPQKFVPN